MSRKILVLPLDNAPPPRRLQTYMRKSESGKIKKKTRKRFILVPTRRRKTRGEKKRRREWGEKKERNRKRKPLLLLSGSSNPRPPHSLPLGRFSASVGHQVPTRDDCLPLQSIPDLLDDALVPNLESRHCRNFRSGGQVPVTGRVADPSECRDGLARD